MIVKEKLLNYLITIPLNIDHWSSTLIFSDIYIFIKICDAI